MNSKWKKDLYVKPKTIKLLEGNRDINLCDHGDFLVMTPKVQATKKKIDKLDFIQISNFLKLVMVGLFIL